MLNVLRFQFEIILGSVVALSVLLVYYIATLAAAMLLVRGVRKVSFPKLYEGLQLIELKFLARPFKNGFLLGRESHRCRLAIRSSSVGWLDDVHQRFYHGLHQRVLLHLRLLAV